MKKIMFNDKYGLTEAVLNGKKTQTRRLMPNGTPLGNWCETEKHAKYKVGEVVAVAQSYEHCCQGETWGKWLAELTNRHIMLDDVKEWKGYKNKMFVKADLMPYHIRITNIHVERLQDISDEDCLAEGISQIPLVNDYTYDINKVMKSNKFTAYETPREAFAVLIDKVSEKGTWDSNPYVFVYDFELVK